MAAVGQPCPERLSQVRDNRAMATTLRTPRVTLREFNASDLEVLVKLMGDEDQMSLYLRPRTRDETNAWLDRHISLYQEHGYGLWLIEKNVGGHFLGYCGIRPRTIEGREETEMAWHIHKLFWNHGLATESAAACRALAFARFGISRLVAVIDPVNEPSHRVAQKIGMRAEREMVLDDWPCVMYSTMRPPLAAFATILDDHRRVLLVRRRDIDVWECPGGTAQRKEAPSDAVVKPVRRQVSASGLTTSRGCTGDRLRTPWSSTSSAT